MTFCKDCKWWDQDSGHDELDELGSDYKLLQRHCTNPKVGARGEGSDEASDAEGYGGIYTGPEFGCIHGEAKS